MNTLFSIVESPTHPNFSSLYHELGLEVITLNSQRKAISQLKKNQPDYIVAEFFYGFNTYYQAVNISNLDVLLNSLVKYSPDTKVIVLVAKDQRQYVDKLNEIVPLHSVLTLPVTPDQLKPLLT
ncbi:hypothetical protein BOW53_12265 [Solemya pervernicosa gill symbiont]|uniref:Response regulatory domain-containing protein n=1 Tax=Solemya pervernicosa gill symbiont TaxID=642797 RepID=A0A1T2L2K9_9GAMM|nr:hypothetical protein [Solemya pervernicosa gill symbiont]OOZ39323.1 hypothetical protein BOW53_12265 [Solemya pervernicosa gill symbiont]